MPVEQTAHVHVCGCGERWTCSKADCHISDECTRCEETALDEWAEANGYHLTQLTFEED